jgi:hypothetical protein
MTKHTFRFYKSQSLQSIVFVWWHLTRAEIFPFEYEDETSERVYVAGGLIFFIMTMRMYLKMQILYAKRDWKHFFQLKTLILHNLKVPEGIKLKLCKLAKII